MKPVIAIALSGGIDSLVAACLLKDQGWQPFGLHFITGFETPYFESGTNHSGSTDFQDRLNTDHHPVMRIGEQLDIPVYLVDCRREFTSEVVGPFCRTYAEGHTPNPCLVCNPKIKFGFLLDIALQKGASALATGHYARIRKDPEGRYHLFKGVDATKDQSYFLAFLNQVQLSRAVFPLHDMTKEAVRAMAAGKNLHPVERAESQDICFISGQRYGDFLTRWAKLEPKPGLIENMSGTVIGEHGGLHLFTIGQRRGINCPATDPYYVVRMNPAENRLTVGTKKDLFSGECRVNTINWIREPAAPVFEAQTKLRYRHRAAPASVLIESAQRATVRFHSPQSAVTPGQGAVFYEDDEVLGGGWIEK
ncbi:MAG: tRNA 2-thiouridine(34) synthase MnmA [Pseudomonadota bacterium]